MNVIAKYGALVFTAMSLLSVAHAADSKVLYENNFDKATVGAVPDDFLVLDGGFAVKEDGKEKFLELPGSPLETYGVLFGPNQKEDVAASARFFGSSKGRRYPVLGLGLNGVGGYKLQVAPAKQAIELYKGDEAKTSVPYEWKSGKWVTLKLQVVKIKDGAWKVQGKVWAEGEKEPEAWMISLAEKEAPVDGRATIWGLPFSGQPIRFDDLKVTPASK